MSTKEKTMDQRAEEYANNTILSPQTYRGDVVTAYVIGCMDQQRLELVKRGNLFLLKYHLSRRSDEGWNQLALVSALTFEEAKEKLIKEKTYNYTDALTTDIVKPDNIQCLNIY